MKRAFSIVLLCVIASVWVSCGVMAEGKSKKSKRIEPETEARLYLFEAAKALDIYGDTAKGEYLLKKSLSINDTADAPYYKLAALYSAAPEKAVVYAEKAYQLDTTNVWYKHLLGALYARNKQYPEAMSIYRNLAQKEPEAEVYKYIAALHEQMGKPYEALSVLDSAEQMFGVSEELSSYRLDLLLNLGHDKKAMEQVKELVDNYPDQVRYMVTLGNFYAMQGRDSMALETYTKASTVSPDDMGLLLAMNSFFQIRRDYINFLRITRRLFALEGLELKAKVKYFNDVIKSPECYQANYLVVDDIATTLYNKHSDDPEVTDLYATHLINSGKIADALVIYKRQLAVKQIDIKPLMNVLAIESHLQHPDSVTHYLKWGLKEYPKSLEIKMQWAYELSRAGEEDQALKEMKGAMKLANNDSLKSVVYGAIGDFEHQMGRSPYKSYDKALKHNPNNILVLNNYSYFMTEEGINLNQAVAMVEKMMTLGADNPTYIDTYAWVLFKAGRLEEAKVAMRQAISLDKQNSPELMLHYGDILKEMGDKYMATIYWKKALEAGYEDKEAISKRLAETDIK